MTHDLPVHHRFRLNLDGVYKGFNQVVNDVLGVDGPGGARIWYWVEEEEDVVKSRISDHRQEIKKALNLHERILGHFEEAEKFSREKKTDGVRIALRELARGYESYLEAVQPIGYLTSNDLRGQEHHFWRFPMYNGLAARTYDDALASVVYIKHLLTGTLNEGIEELEFDFNFLFPKKVGPNPGSFGDMSVRGRLLFVKEDLKDRFGLDVDEKELAQRV